MILNISSQYLCYTVDLSPARGFSPDMLQLIFKRFFISIFAFSSIFSFLHACFPSLGCFLGVGKRRRKKDKENEKKTPHFGTEKENYRAVYGLKSS